MNKFTTLLVGSALAVLIASYGFAADATSSAASSGNKSQPAIKELKIGYITMAKVAAGSTGGKAAAATIESKSEKLRAKIEAKQKELESQKNVLEAKFASMSAKEREAKGKEFQKKVEEYQKLVQSSEKEMQQLQEKLTKELYESIKKASAQYAKSNGYTALIEEKAVLYLADGTNTKDLTEEITKLLNQKPRAK